MPSLLCTVTLLFRYPVLEFTLLRRLCLSCIAFSTPTVASIIFFCFSCFHCQSLWLLNGWSLLPLAYRLLRSSTELCFESHLLSKYWFQSKDYPGLHTSNWQRREQNLNLHFIPLSLHKNWPPLSRCVYSNLQIAKDKARHHDSVNITRVCAVFIYEYEARNFREICQKYLKIHFRIYWLWSIYEK